MELVIEKVRNLRGTPKIPGDKSISHRVLMIGALTEGKIKVKNFLRAADTLSTKACLEALGVEIKDEEDSLIISGCGLYGMREPGDVLNVGNSGTTLRILPGILSAQSFFSVITGDASLRKRPMRRIIEPLSMMGAKIWAREEGNFAPLAIVGNPLSAISYSTPVPSAQVKSCLILAGLLAEGITEVSEKFKSRDHTERMLKLLGAEIEILDNSVKVAGKKPFGKGEIEIDIPSDFSSAAYFVAAALIVPNSEIYLRDVGINPTRCGFLRVLERMGAKIEIVNENFVSNEPRADIIVRSAKLKGVKIEAKEVPQIIDEIPLIAVLGTQAEGETEVRGAKELRIKETDRIAAIHRELSKMGARVEEFEDGFLVLGNTKLRGCKVESYNDHRMAMSLAVAGLIAEGKTVIKDAECIDISFPSFKRVLSSVVGG